MNYTTSLWGQAEAYSREPHSNWHTKQWSPDSYYRGIEFACLASSEKTSPDLIKSVLSPSPSQHLSWLLPVARQPQSWPVGPASQLQSACPCLLGKLWGLTPCFKVLPRGCKFLWCLDKQMRGFWCLNSRRWQHLRRERMSVEKLIGWD